jgi:uncharacterized repeat protein (TIGR03803 family)
MHKTSINRTLTLAGFAPAGKLNHTSCSLTPQLELFVAALGKLNRARRMCAVLALCAAAAIALPAQTFTVLFSFDLTDGGQPDAPLVQAANGDLYGTTQFGGANPSSSSFGAVTVFKTTPSGSLTTLYSFCSQSGCADGEFPFGAALVHASNGKLYGTTGNGGANERRADDSLQTSAPKVSAKTAPSPGRG